MIDSLLLHPKSRRQLENFIQRPAHGIMLVGLAGSGKKTIARTLAAAMLSLAGPNELVHYPYLRIIEPGDTGNITIEAIREVQSFLTLRTPGHEPGIKRVLLVYEAGRMGIEAQNAFLKTLEEPPADTCIILTSTIDRPTLPTIRSRAQSIDILPVSFEDSISYYTTNYPGLYQPRDIQTAYALAAGQTGLQHALITETDHALRTWVNTAKQLLSGSTFERLAKVEELSKDKTNYALLLDALQRIARAALRSAATQHKTAAVQRWHDALGLIDDAGEALTHNANTKLVLTNLLMNL